MEKKDHIYILQDFDKNRFKAICFIDVDGTITNGPNSWEHLHERLGTAKEAEKNTKLFFEGKINYDEWAKRDVELWKGRTKEEIESILSEIKIRKDTDKAVKRLEKMGCYIVLISGGLKALVERIAKSVGAHAYVANDIVYDNNQRVVKAISKVAMNKELVADEILKKLNVLKSEIIVIAIGDSINDISLFKWADYSIAINPTHSEVHQNSHEIVETDSFCDVAEKIAQWLNLRKKLMKNTG